MTIEHEVAGAAGSDSWYGEQTATFGDRLTAAREALGLSREELADRIGVRLTTIRHWEEDAKEPRANRLQMLAGMLNVSLMWLLTGEGQGLTAPDDRRGLGGEAAALLGELHAMRGVIGGLAEQMGRVEARLRLALAREAA